jgi:hypothetical protein
MARKALPGVPREVTPVEIPPAAERLLRGPVYEPRVDEAGRGPGKIIPRIPERNMHDGMET